MTESELGHEIFLVSAQLEKEHQQRMRIIEFAKDSKDDKLAISVIKECQMIRKQHAYTQAYEMF